MAAIRSLGLSLYLRLRAQPFRLNVTVAIFQILLVCLFAMTFIRAAMQSHFGCWPFHRHNLEGFWLVAGWSLARRVHAHLELGGDLERPDFTNASRVHLSSLLLITRCQFESTSTS